MGKEVVVVDDQEDILFVIKAILTRNKFKVAVDQTGKILETVNPNTTGLIILDINLERVDGRELCKNLKSNLTTKSIPVIFVSAIDNLKEICREYGANDYLSKPFDIDELMSKVNKYVVLLFSIIFSNLLI